MKKHIIFDVDGTLLDSEEAVLLSFQETLYRKTGKKTDIRDLKYALGIDVYKRQACMSIC